MRRPLLVAGLLVVGLALMANPVYLPVAAGEPTHAYSHTVQPVDDGTPTYDGSDVVDSGELDADARAAFERALEAEGGGFVVEDRDARVDSLAYPDAPRLGDGLVIIAHEGTEYEFWTRTVEREPTAVVTQRVVVQPFAFLAGFLATLAAVAVGYRDRLNAVVDGEY